ncbi:Hypothetical protein FKW44_020596 [Caligus rogercresseyi]|uniref:Uncharacterized protein n=1 Tax=Caligus rogercresseyi TaxID=217165 RepID=A0A7T8GXK1_CALRO|nr:Hypothetical protein FKW44_020596 [Caligus rogercresseyi]
MQNELNTNKYFKFAYSANRCHCAVKSVPERLPLGISVEGNPPPSLYGAPLVKNPPRRLIRTP